jgi:hypothetical protein
MAPGGEAEDPFWQELLVPLSPMHLVQPLADAPAAVTVIDRDLIRAMGARKTTAWTTASTANGSATSLADWMRARRPPSN